MSNARVGAAASPTEGQAGAGGGRVRTDRRSAARGDSAASRPMAGDRG